MFENFEERWIDTGEAEIFLRVGGSGPPLVLLHGYPETHACWHAVAPTLAERFTVICPDLRGYGRSRGPAPDAANERYAKRAMAQDVVTALDTLGYDRAVIAGHDRGGRVGYRLALDHPDRISRFVAVDIVPTVEQWERMRAPGAIKGYHWAFLAQPDGLPERMIGADPEHYLRHTIRSWVGDDAAITDDAWADYVAAAKRPEVVAAWCADYRAGATVDWRLDAADRDDGRRLACPVHVLAGTGYLGPVAPLLEIWSPWCATPPTGAEAACGHFLAEEAPEVTAAEIAAFAAG